MIILLLILLIPCKSYAGEENQEDNIGSIHQSVKKRWKNLNHSLDSFFSGENYEEDLNESYIRMNFGMKLVPSGKPSFEYNVRLRTHLPKTTKKIQLLVEKESKYGGFDNSGVLRNDFEEIANNNDFQQALDDNTYSTAGRYRFLDERYWKLFTDFGLKNELPLNPFGKFRLKRSFEGQAHRLDITSKLEYYRIEKFAQSLDVDYLFKYSDDYRLALLNSWSRLQLEDISRFSNAISLQEKISPFVSLAQSLRANGENKPVVSVNNYNIAMTVRVLTYSYWFFTSATMAANFPREHKFSGSPYAIFAWEIFI